MVVVLSFTCKEGAGSLTRIVVHSRTEHTNQTLAEARAPHVFLVFGRPQSAAGLLGKAEGIKVVAI